jgi:hypothetical protein
MADVEHLWPESHEAIEVDPLVEPISLLLAEEFLPNCITVPVPRFDKFNIEIESEARKHLAEASAQHYTCLAERILKVIEKEKELEEQKKAEQEIIEAEQEGWES